MAKSRNRRKNGTAKKCTQRDFAGNPISAKNKSASKNWDRKNILRTELLSNACDSLTAKEVEDLISSGAGSNLEYVSVVLDDNGIPVDGDTKVLKLSNLDIERLTSIKSYKTFMEAKMASQTA